MVTRLVSGERLLTFLMGGFLRPTWPTYAQFPSSFSDLVFCGEVRCSKFQTPSGFINFDFSLSTSDKLKSTNPQELPDKECSLEQLLQRLREVLSLVSPSAPRALSILDHIESTLLAKQLTSTAIFF
ncbi:hypothetical protein AVEN_258666-1 [Araneus ventricosus]|uniref:Uncharacterized protein n=1 Tax=Araneus ventricosus TaxID=182803 RepID=A0A4Y2EC22_ARAVE|nr:hypothetical protein AVEN_258666-1 [Araneus ventricosus]